MRLESTSISAGATLPVEYTVRGGNKRPRLRIEDVPHSAKSLALLFYDLDKGGGTWIHWMVWNIPPDSKEIKGTEGTTSSGEKGYSGPNLPADSGIHRFVFHVYALNKDKLNLQPTADLGQFHSAISGRVVEEAKMMVRYGMPKKVERKKQENTNWF